MQRSVLSFRVSQPPMPARNSTAKLNKAIQWRLQVHTRQRLRSQNAKDTIMGSSFISSLCIAFVMPAQNGRQTDFILPGCLKGTLLLLGNQGYLKCPQWFQRLFPSGWRQRKYRKCIYFVPTMSYSESHKTEWHEFYCLGHWKNQWLFQKK